MSTEKMNSEFEVWRKEQIASLMRTGYPEAAKAFRDLGSIHWMAWQSSWQASRAAIDVELPVRMEFAEKGGDYFDGARNGYNQCIDACAVSLKFAGLKVKP